jgi:ribosomal protein L37AE/L43A
MNKPTREEIERIEHSCPECSCPDTERTLGIEDMGTDAQGIVLGPIEVPIWVCNKCNFAWTEQDAETVRTEHIIRILRKTISEIVSMAREVTNPCGYGPDAMLTLRQALAKLDGGDNA